MMLAGIFAAGIYVAQVCKKNGYDESDGTIFLLLVSIGIIAGGHVLYSIVNYQTIIRIIKNIHVINSWEIFFNAVYLVFGGSIFYGGLFGGIIAAIIILKKKPQLKYLLDIASPAVPLFHFFGRIGCFLAGCCFGIESDFGFTFSQSIIEEANGVNRFPVQLLEALFNLVLFFILDYFRRKNYFKQGIIYIYLISYSAARFFIEFLRGDEYRGFIFSLSTSQLISILVFCITAPKLYLLLKNKNILF